MTSKLNPGFEKPDQLANREAGREDLRWTGIPSMGSSVTPGCFVLKKPVSTGFKLVCDLILTSSSYKV